MLKHSLRSKRFLSSKRFYYALLARLIAPKLAREGKRVIRREGEWRKENLSLLSNTPSPPSPSPSFFFVFVFVLFLFFFVLLSNLLAITRAERERSGKRRSGLYNLEGEQTRINITTGPRYHLILR